MARRSARGHPPSASRLHHPPHAPWQPPARVPVIVRIQHDPRISAPAAQSETQALPCATQHKSRQVQYLSKRKKVDLRKSTETTRNQPNRSYGFRIPEINSARYFHPPSRTKRLRNRASLKSAPEKILLLFHPKTSAPAYRSRLGEPLWVATHEPYSPPPFMGRFSCSISSVSLTKPRLPA